MFEWKAAIPDSIAKHLPVLRHLLFHQSFLPETINKSLQRELGRVSCSGEHGEMFWLEIYVKWSIFSYHSGDSGLNYDEI